MSQSIVTSFNKLNENIPLVPGLHVIGGRPEIGITDFLLQIADSIATQGTPVMFISLMNNVKEIGAKIVSRRIKQSDSKLDVTPNDVLEGKASKSRILKQTLQDLSDGQHIIILHPNKAITASQLIKLLTEYRTKCTQTPVIMIDALDDLADATDVTYQEQAIMAIANWQLVHHDTPVILHCYTKDMFQRYMTLNAFNFPNILETCASTVSGIQLRELSAKEFYGTRDEDGDLHATSLRKQQKIANDAMNAKIRHLSLHLIKNDHAHDRIDYDYDRNHAILIET